MMNGFSRRTSCTGQVKLQISLTEKKPFISHPGQPLALTDHGDDAKNLVRHFGDNIEFSRRARPDSTVRLKNYSRDPLPAATVNGIPFPDTLLKNGTIFLWIFSRPRRRTNRPPRRNCPGKPRPPPFLKACKKDTFRL